MKSLLLLLIFTLVASCVAFDFESIDASNFPTMSEETVDRLGRIFSLLLVKRLETAKLEVPTPKFPIIPPLPDVFPLPDLSIHLANDSGITDFIYGDIQTCYANASGLSGIKDDLKINVFTSPSRFDYKLTFDNISLDGLQDIEIFFLSQLDSPYKFNMTSRENFFIKIYKFVLNLKVQVHLLGLINLTGAKLDLDEDAISFDIFFNNAIIDHVANGVPKRSQMTEEIWKVTSNKLTIAFRNLWKKFLEEALSTAVTKALHNLFKDCYIVPLLLQNLDCLNLPNGMTIDEMLAEDIGKFVKVSEESPVCPISDRDPPGPTDPTDPSDPTTNPSSKGSDSLAKSNILISSILLLLVKFYLI